MIPCRETSSISRSIGRDGRVTVAWGCGKRRGITANDGEGVSFWDDGNVLELDSGNGHTKLQTY